MYLEQLNLYVLKDLCDLVQVTAGLLQSCMYRMLGGFQIVQSSKVGGTIVVEVRRR